MATVRQSAPDVRPYVVHPGKKLLFMEVEFGQRREWNHDEALDWQTLQGDQHSGLQRWVEDLNRFYRGEPTLYQLDFDPDGFQWIDAQDSEASVLSYLRKARDGMVEVEADCLADGHDMVACALLWRQSDAVDWQRTAMRPMSP